MQISRVRLTSFRNIASADWCPPTGINLLIGKNAQGKTSFLEALQLLSTTRSPRTSRDADLIRRGSESSQIGVEVETEAIGLEQIEMFISGKEKRIVRINGSKKPRVVDLLGKLLTISFGARDLAIVQGEPSDRRLFLNLDISQISPRYVADLANYKRALEQRNRLLKDLRDRPPRDDSLEAWTAQLIDYGSRIMEKREEYLKQLAPLARNVHSGLTRNSEELEIFYAPCIERMLGEEYAEALKRAFVDRQREEIRRGVTVIGPQRDDAAIHIDGQDARTFGSQGQQRTAALSIRLAELELMQELASEPPVLLLDDVMSDLDDERRGMLLERVLGKCQTFITCTETREFPQAVLVGAAHWKVEEGSISKMVD